MARDQDSRLGLLWGKNWEDKGKKTRRARLDSLQDPDFSLEKGEMRNTRQQSRRRHTLLCPCGYPGCTTCILQSFDFSPSPNPPAAVTLTTTAACSLIMV